MTCAYCDKCGDLLPLPDGDGKRRCMHGCYDKEVKVIVGGDKIPVSIIEALISYQNNINKIYDKFALSKDEGPE